jgi:P-type Ca2+ transporter type 2C
MANKASALPMEQAPKGPKGASAEVGMGRASAGRVDAHAWSIEQTAKELNTDLVKGLTSAEAHARLQQYGYNELKEKPRPGLLSRIWDQLNNFLIIILIGAAAISAVIGWSEYVHTGDATEFVDVAAILAIVILNTTLGVVQESKAEAALDALKKMAAPSARVVRDGQQTNIPARELVIGDLVMVEAGNYMPADLRLIEAVNMKSEEASLTGESVPVDKKADVILPADAPIGDRDNSAFMSMLVTYGRGSGIVTATGMDTQLGQIAEMLQEYEDEATPLQVKLDELGKTLGIVALSVCGFIFLFGVIRDTDPAMAFTEGLGAYWGAHGGEVLEFLMTAVSLAIAAVPEGLSAVVTVCLALGMQRMVARNALIRKLPAVETLGSATVICSDKTGTLTQNQMTVTAGWAGGQSFQATGEGYDPVGEFYRDGQTFSPNVDAGTSLLLHGMMLCNDAKLEQATEEGGQSVWKMIGDPTEGAMVVVAAKAGLSRDDTHTAYPRLAEIPFDSDRKMMTTIHEAGDLATRINALKNGSAAPTPDPYVAFVKGGPDIVLSRCDDVVLGDRIVPLTPELRDVILEANHAMATSALRVLGAGFRTMAEIPAELEPETVERRLTFLGLQGMIDPARPEVKVAVGKAKRAGLRSIMITGDYRDTAQAIADQIGMLTEGGSVVTGADIDAMSDDELDGMVLHLNTCARSSPQHKMRIVDSLKRREHVVAMTGDGVNDAPALKRANIGVAMGITGTDVTKQTADMVLTDDNYASIVSAIEEGRVIYSNIRKFVFYLISCNVGEVLIIFLAMLAGLPSPLRPIQLLFLNLVSDGAPALALGMERGEPDIMERPPRPVRESIINTEMMIGIAVQAVVMTVAVLGAYLFAGAFPRADVEETVLKGWQTVAFATLTVSELLRAFTARSERISVFKIGLFSNKWMLGAVGLSLTLVLLTIYVPALQTVFGTVPLTLRDWAWILPFALLASIAAELTKIYLRARAKRIETARAAQMELA